jgi:hypothetical protein
LAIFSVEHTADVAAGTVYKSVLDVKAGFDCPNILYDVAILYIYF